MNTEALSIIGWRQQDAQALPTDLPEAARVVRIIAQHRSGYRAHDGVDELTVQIPAAWMRPGADPRQRPAVGDWVVIVPDSPPMIERCLRRRTLLARAAAGERHMTQAIAANIDYVLIVCGLDGDYNPRRIERYLILIDGSGALPVVVLTKRDLCPEAEERRAEIELLVGPAGVVLTVDSKSPTTLDILKPYLGPGATAVLVGSSGAGKSTLTNTLLGEERMRTGAVRETDSRGRHTTTHRALLALPSGGCLIDTPGMREIKFTGEEVLAEGHFADIEALALQCRFSDCQHRTEPGCRVRAALESGELAAAHYEHYDKLRAELDAARGSVQAQLKRKSNDKVLNKALNKRLKDKYGSR